ncbi:AI-2E family transporter [Modestobacter lapidis]|nr:AI-2E family transporter [Modestobacter lapidis]
MRRRSTGAPSTPGAGRPVPDGSAPDVDGGPGVDRTPTGVVPAWTLRVLAVSGAVLAGAGVAWLAFWLLFRLPLLTLSLLVGLLLAALAGPIARRLTRSGVPRGVSALVGVLAPFAVVAGIGVLIGFRAVAQLQDLTRPLAAGVDRIRVWLIEGPLGLDPTRVSELRNEIVTQIYAATPAPADGARLGLSLLAALVLTAFLTFFLIKDGGQMWSWLLDRVPDRARTRVDGAGRAAWDTLSHYVRGVIVVALIDAVGIGAALFLLDVPLWISLTLLTFIGAFVPIFGATLSGAVAVLVTLVTNGFTDAVIVLVVVLVVQQLEGNVLQPVIMGRALHLHPAAILLAVTAGTLLAGIAGALFAVPLLAASYRAVEYLRTAPDGAGAAPPGNTAPSTAAS